MKQLIVVLTYFSAIINSAGQEIKVERATMKELFVSAYSLHAVNEFKGGQIAIKLIETHSITGHSDNQSQDAVVSDFLLIVKEITGENPTNADFWVRGQFYNPRNFKFDPTDKSLSFQHGDKKTKTTTLIISTKEIKVK